MSSSSPLHEHSNIELHNKVEAKSEMPSKIKALFAQMDVPMKKKEHRFDPTFYKCDKKIVKYEASGLHIWKALVSFSHTILSDWDTWSHLGGLTVICFATMGICLATGSYKSISESNSVVSRIQVLISFVFAAYITIVINRWDRIRNTTLGQVWGAIENLNLLANQVLCTTNTEQDSLLSDRLLRHSRLCFQLLFKAVQNDPDLSTLRHSDLLREDEEQYLEQCTVGTRSLVLVSWISEFFTELRSKYQPAASDIFYSNVIGNITSLRGGIGATQGCIGTQLPYPYVHVVYWTIQILLSALAVETGVVLAVMVYTKKNGNGDYSPNDDTVEWPQNQSTWYANNLLQITAQNIVFALFCEGMLKICDKLSNPMSKDDTSFSERVFDAFLHNNCKAMRAGIISYKQMSQKDPVL